MAAVEAQHVKNKKKNGRELQTGEKVPQTHCSPQALGN